MSLGTKARLSVRKLRSSSKISGHCACAFRWKIAFASLLSSTLVSTASFAAVTSLPSKFGTSATLSYRRTKNLRAVQLLLGHSKLESTVRYLGIEVDDALEISEQTEI